MPWRSSPSWRPPRRRPSCAACGRPAPSCCTARPTTHGWRLAGTQAVVLRRRRLDRALLTATDPDGVVRLFDVDVGALRFADDWHPIGMRASDSRTGCVDVEVAASDQVGAARRLRRPARVLARWHRCRRLLARPGRRASAHDLADHAARRDDPFARAAGRPGHRRAGRRSRPPRRRRRARSTAGPTTRTPARRRAPLVRVAVAEAARMVLDTSVVVQGASALCFDADHGRAVADLTVYLGQLHHGTDAASIDAGADDDWWSA